MRLPGLSKLSGAVPLGGLSGCLLLPKLCGLSARGLSDISGAARGVQDVRGCPGTVCAEAKVGCVFVRFPSFRAGCASLWFVAVARGYPEGGYLV